MTENRQEFERLIVTSRDKFRALVDGLEDAVMSIDPSFRIISANQALARSLDLHPRMVVGRRCHQILYGLEHPCPKTGIPCPAVTTFETKRVEVVQHDLTSGHMDDNGPRFMEVRAMPVFNKAGDMGEVLLVRRDVTRQRLAEIQIKEHNMLLEQEVKERTRELVGANEQLLVQRNELASTNDELMSLQDLKEDLTDMVIHDLKGPLSEIQANLEMLKFDSLSELQAEFVEAAQLGGDDLLRMITNLLDVSRLEENRMVLDKQPFDINERIKDLKDRLGPMARLRQVNINTRMDQDLPLLLADQRLFERIMNNLLSNALDYVAESGHIELTVSFSDNYFRFSVQDDGPGIAEELHEKIFEKFSQGQQGRPRTSSGLGLTFCRMAVEAHDGRIWVESQPDHGSTFTFVLPYVPYIGEEMENGDD